MLGRSSGQYLLTRIQEVGHQDLLGKYYTLKSCINAEVRTKIFLFTYIRSRELRTFVAIQGTVIPLHAM